MQVVDFIELDSLLSELVAVSESYFFETFDLFTCLYNTGLRINELNTLNERIETETFTHYDVITEKTNNIRTIAKTDVPLLIQRRITENTSIMKYNSILTINYYMKLKGFRNWTVNGSKNETTHLFRHRKAKQLQHNGLTTLEIANYFSITTAVALEYINSIIIRPL